MTDSDVKNAAKTAVGLSLSDSAGEVCMRTRCQDVIPRILSGSCKEEGKGRAARKLCKPLLSECQNDAEAQEQCATRCARYFKDDGLKRCIRDCNLARCRVYPPYDDCVARRTLLDVLSCMEAGEGRADAESCLRERCGLEVNSQPLSADHTHS